MNEIINIKTTKKIHYTCDNPDMTVSLRSFQLQVIDEIMNIKKFHNTHDNLIYDCFIEKFFTF